LPGLWGWRANRQKVVPSDPLRQLMGCDDFPNPPSGHTVRFAQGIDRDRRSRIPSIVTTVYAMIVIHDVFINFIGDRQNIPFQAQAGNRLQFCRLKTCPWDY
jgi:hypothetical protein